MRSACTLLVLAASLAGEDAPRPEVSALSFLAGQWSGPMGGGTFHA